LNGKTYYGKQNHQCKICGRQFVLNSKQKIITDEEKAKTKKLLLERISLLGICRVMDVSLTWLLTFIIDLYSQTPDDIGVKIYEGEQKEGVMIRALEDMETEADEMWSFVGSKKNKQWIWIAIDAKTRQIIAFHVGDRSRSSAEELWKKVPDVYKRNSVFYTDDWDAYKGVIPEKQHVVADKKSGKTNIIERFNCTMRQRVSRLVRFTLSFSKKIENHIGAIKYFIYHYNLALHV